MVQFQNQGILTKLKNSLIWVHGSVYVGNIYFIIAFEYVLTTNIIAFVVSRRLCLSKVIKIILNHNGILL